MINWFNSDWKSYLEKGDKVETHIQPNVSAIRLQCIFILFFFGIFSIPFFIIFHLIPVPDDSIGKNFLFIIQTFFIIIGICILFTPLFIYLLIGKTTHYVLTNKGIYCISGLISKTVKFVPYNRITDAIIERGIIGHIYNVSSIGISTASTNSIILIDRESNVLNSNKQFEIYLLYIDNFDTVRQTILKKINDKN